MLTDHDEEHVPAIDWGCLSRVLVVGNGKGGVGKTTIAANTGGLAAAGGARSLIVDLNGQGNVGRELGYRKGPLDDEGQALYEAVMNGTPLMPIRDVRPNLDIAVGGPHVGRLPAHLSLKYDGHSKRQALMLAVALQQVADNYDIIVIDSPPENPPLQQLSLAAARWLIVPVKSDSAAIEDGLGGIARQFALVRKKVNPFLELLGVVLFASGTSSTAIRRGVADDVERTIGKGTPMFESVVRHSEAVARQSRERGLLVHELEQAAANNPAFWQVRAGEVSSDQVVSQTSKSVAEDMARLTREVFTRLRQREGIRA
ncbi:ParA family protein [Streptomyces sp. NPDC087659]|uniref:ParA family protein n=1 Tax=Streptomyces sp. NPDC087659 TaxID=3365801 RepID=UPI0038034641